MMKKTNLILLGALCGAGLLCALGATSQKYSFNGVAGMVTEYMLSFSAGNSVANRTTTAHGLAQPLSGSVNTYEAGNGVWSTFDSLWRNPADVGPFPNTTGEMLVRVGSFWTALQPGSPGDVLHWGDDPNTIGTANSVFWGPPSESGGVESDSDSGTALDYVAFFSHNNGRRVKDSAVIYRYGTSSFYIDEDLTVNGSAYVDNISAGNITMSGTLAPAGGGEINHGFYTPALGAAVNAASVTAFQSQWARVGNTVTVSGKLAADAIVSGTVSVSIALPAASNFSAEQNCAGSGASSNGSVPAVVYGRAANDDALLTYQSPGPGVTTLFFSFTYLVQ